MSDWMHQIRGCAALILFGIGLTKAATPESAATDSVDSAPSVIPSKLWRLEGPWELSVSVAAGYSHYEAKQLNEVLRLLEQLTRESAGTNPYPVAGFDGHPAILASLGLRKGPWRLALETEFWTEEFEQSEVPFNLEDNKRGERITCNDLRAQESQLNQGLAGCIQAQETFIFLPISLQLSWMPQWTPWLRGGFGYGLGILGGSAQVDLRAEYFGSQAAPDDHISFSIVPDPIINPVHKVFATVELTPWRWLGWELRGGWRGTQLGGFTLDDKSGSSQVFDAAFDYPENGDQMWIRSPVGFPERRQIWIGKEAEARSVSSRFQHELVYGDFDGWFLATSLQWRWSIP